MEGVENEMNAMSILISLLFDLKVIFYVLIISQI